MWLDRVDASIDCLVLVANIYSLNVDFSALSDAYLRIVNADTNQEMGRMELGQGKMRGNAIVFAKLYRYGGQWQVMAVGLPIQTQPGHSSFKALLPAIINSGCAFPPPPKGHQGLIIAPCVVATEIVPVTVQQQQQQEGEEVRVKPQLPTHIQQSPKIARSTIAGVAAATAIFAGGALTLAHFEPDLFEAGVDFGADGLESVSDLLPEMDLGGAGDWAMEGIGEAGEAIGDVVAVSEVAGVAVGAVGDVAGSVGGAVGSVTDTLTEGDLVGTVLLSDAAAVAGGNLVTAVGSVGGFIGRKGSEMNNMASGVGSEMSNMASGVGSAISNAASGAIGDAQSQVSNVADSVGGHAAQAGEAVLNGVGAVAGGALGLVGGLVGGLLG
jgi:hypothetical protein